MRTASTIGLDIAMSVFQVHGVDEAGQVITPVSQTAICLKLSETGTLVRRLGLAGFGA